jgi:hypothetical protein
VESRMLTSRDSAKREPPAPDLLDSKHRDDMRNGRVLRLLVGFRRKQA